MSLGDILGVLIVYIYVGSLLFIFDFASERDHFINRKLIHILVGNIVFVVPLFDNRWVIVLLAAAPFILITYIVSPISSISTNSKTSHSGHGLGLVYYSISWTLLALLFFDHPEIIAVGVICMSYGDGSASLFGKRYGEHFLKIARDKKSVEGSTAIFFVSISVIITTLYIFGSLPENLLIIPLVVGIATIIEIFSIKGFDNILVAVSSSISYYILISL
ncbi:MAG: diacylglycerol/polyprenol kinase family protein [Thermoplasmata archaeon]